MKQAKQRARFGGTRTLLILAAIALVLILLAGALLWQLFSALSDGPAPKGELPEYLAEHWTVFRLRSWDAGTGALELDYPLRFSYAQMEKYGASLEELRTLPEGNLATASALRTAARERIGVTIASVTVYGLTNDGKIAYTLFPDGSVESCWEP